MLFTESFETMTFALLDVFFKKMGQTRPLFVYFNSFHIANIAPHIINDKSIDDLLWTQTRGGKMVGGAESTELWRHPALLNVCATEFTHIS